MFVVVSSAMFGWVGNLFVIVVSSVISCLGCCFLNDNCYMYVLDARLV